MRFFMLQNKNFLLNLLNLKMNRNSLLQKFNSSRSEEHVRIISSDADMLIFVIICWEK